MARRIASSHAESFEMIEITSIYRSVISPDLLPHLRWGARYVLADVPLIFVARCVSSISTEGNSCWPTRQISKFKTLRKEINNYRLAACLLFEYVYWEESLTRSRIFRT